MGEYANFTGQINLNKKLNSEQFLAIENFLSEIDSPLEIQEWMSTDCLTSGETSDPDRVPAELKELITKFFKPWGVTLDGSLIGESSSCDINDWIISADGYTIKDEAACLVTVDEHLKNLKLLDYFQLHYPNLYNEALTAIGEPEANPEEDEGDRRKKDEQEGIQP